MAAAPGATTSSSSGCGARSSTRRSTCEPTTASARRVPPSAGIWIFTIANARIRALMPERRTGPTSITCRSARQHEFRCGRVLTPVGLRRRVGAADYSTAPLTEPDMRTRIRLLGLISECQHKLVGDPWGVQLVPARLERDHPIAKPCGRVGFRHARPVRFHPTPLAAVRSPGGRLSTDLAGQQMSEQEAWPLLLVYDDRPDPAANMGVDDPKFRRRLRCA